MYSRWDDAKALKERLEAATGERISALEGIGESVRPEKEADGKIVSDGRRLDRESSSLPSMEGIEGKDVNAERDSITDKTPDPSVLDKRVEMDLGL